MVRILDIEVGDFGTTSSRFENKVDQICDGFRLMLLERLEPFGGHIIQRVPSSKDFGCG